MHHRDLLLKALKYPKPSNTLLDNDVEFATLILWLENTKVCRHLPLALQTFPAMHAETDLHSRRWRRADPSVQYRR